tara:strand:+ start:99 stop:422 length:324 start_codon:yes stop_codon:yes gene_type:complete
MNFVYFNAVIISLFSAVLISTAIRDKKNGNYLGFKNINVLVYAVALLIIEFYFMISKYGVQVHAILRATGSAIIPFICGYVFVVLTQKELYGNDFKMGRKVNKKGSS